MRRTALALAALCWCARPAASEDAVGKIFVREDGVYRLSFEELRDAGVTPKPVLAAKLSLSVGGEPVPLWVEDGGDGMFGPRDKIEFIGEHLRGADSYFNPYSDLNVYWLQIREPGSPRFRSQPPAANNAARTAGSGLFRRVRFEEDQLLLRFSRSPESGKELWYWARLSAADPEPWALPLPLEDRLEDAAQPVRLTVALRGWSWQQGGGTAAVPDHAVELRLNSTLLATVSWDGQQARRIEVPAVPAEAWLPSGNRLTLTVPARERDGNPVVDVVALNWIELSFPTAPRLAASQARFERFPGSGAELPRLAADGVHSLVLLADGGLRIEAALRAGQALRLPPGSDVRWLWAVADEAFLKPVAVARAHPPRLKDAAQSADYVMVAHPSLSAAVEPLAELHRRRGLKVTVVDVEEIYDEFAHGIVSPAAIREFVSYAYHHWAPPRLRFLLLIGDASWDPRAKEGGGRHEYSDWGFLPADGNKVRKNISTDYEGNAWAQNRNLVPTGSYLTAQGTAASDNEFAAIDGEDRLPDLAVGRFPVVTPAEVSAIVAKTVRYITAPEAGDWRRRMLWITNEDEAMRSNGDRLAELVAEQGYQSKKVYPDPRVRSNAELQGELRSAIDAGYAVVHFHGHGGRYIWRTGIADLKRSQDLFTLDDLEELTPSGRLPIVLSMTCYSAPFDHPMADSIGEKFLRLPDKGAVAVIAASWRIAPLLEFSQSLVKGLLSTETVGEALMQAKRSAPILQLIELYNLLGDPALPMVRPESAGAN